MHKPNTMNNLSESALRTPDQRTSSVYGQGSWNQPQPNGSSNMDDQRYFQTPVNRPRAIYNNANVDTMATGGHQSNQPKQNNFMRMIPKFQEIAEIPNGLDQRNSQKKSEYLIPYNLGQLGQQSSSMFGQLRQPQYNYGYNYGRQNVHNQESMYQNVQNQNYTYQSSQTNCIPNQPLYNHQSQLFDGSGYSANQENGEIYQSNSSQFENQHNSYAQIIPNVPTGPQILDSPALQTQNQLNFQHQQQPYQVHSLNQNEYQIIENESQHQYQELPQNQHFPNSQPLMFDGMNQMRQDIQMNQTFAPQINFFSQFDLKQLQFLQILSQNPENISYQELIRTHPWSPMNPNRSQLQNQPNTLQRLAFDSLLKTNFMLLNKRRQLNAPDSFFSLQCQYNRKFTNEEYDMYGHSKNYRQNGKLPRFEQQHIQESYELENIQSTSEFLERERMRKWQELQNRNQKTYRPIIQVIIMPGPYQSEDEEIGPIIRRKKLLACDQAKTISSKKKTARSKHSQDSCSEQSITRTKSTNDSSSDSPNSNQTKVLPKIGDKYEKQNPKVSEFSISKYDKPFSIKYTINLGSHEASAWKWWLYRMRNAIKGTYKGKVQFERFVSYYETERSLIDDVLQKNEKLRIFLNDSRQRKFYVSFQNYSQKTFQHDGDLTGLIVAPFQLRLPEGYTYTYDSYSKGQIYELHIENEFVKIEYHGGIKFNQKDEGQRDWRKKIKLERNRAWFGDDIVRNYASVIFLKPTSKQVIIEGQEENQKMSIDDSRMQYQREEWFSNRHRTLKGNRQVFKTVDWIQTSTRQQISLKGKLQIFAILVLPLLLTFFYKHLLPLIKQ